MCLKAKALTRPRHRTPPRRCSVIQLRRLLCWILAHETAGVVERRLQSKGNFPSFRSIQFIPQTSVGIPLETEKPKGEILWGSLD